MTKTFDNGRLRLEQCLSQIESKINSTFESLQIYDERLSELTVLYEEKAAKLREDKKRASENNRAESEIQLGKLRQMREAVLKHVRIISSHTSFRPNPSTAQPIEPDLTYLKRESFTVIDNADKEDPLAAKLMEISAGYVSWIDQRMEIVQSRTEAFGAGNEEAELQERFSAEKAELDREINSTTDHIAQQLAEEHLRDLCKILSEYEKFHIQTIGSRKWAPKIPDCFDSLFQREIPDLYSSNDKTVRLPVLLNRTPNRPVFIQYQPLSEIYVSGMVQAICLGWIENNSPGHSRIFLLDQINRNPRILGQLAVIAGEKTSPVAAVPRTEEEMSAALNTVERIVQSIEEQLEYGSFEDYNQKHAGKGVLTNILLILHDRSDNSIDGISRNIIQNIIYNGLRCGVQTLWIRQSVGRENTYGPEWLEDMNYRYPESIRITENNKRSSEFFMFSGDKKESFEFIRPKAFVTREILEGLLVKDDSASLETEYFKRYPMHLPKRSQEGRKSIEVPIGIDSLGQAVIMNFDGVNFAAYIMGAAGSGKSTLLHTIIAGFVMNYHPDEVELWLADFNKVEFATYMKHPLPHVKNILLDDSRELVFDLVDQLHGELKYRLQYLSKHNVQDIRDLSLLDKLPVIVVIIDEFARMSDVLKHEPAYQEKMTELLQAGRKPGFKFVFSSQNYNNGIQGLRDEAKNQIQNRIALMNPDRSEITGVLAIPADQMTDQISEWIAELPAYYSIVKFTDKQRGYIVRRIRNFYPSPSEDPLEGMRQLSGFIQSGMLAVKDTGVSEQDKYLEKTTVYLDGNVPKTFDEQLPDILLYEEQNRNELLEGDVRMYPGSPRGFYPVRSFELIQKPYQNVLVAGGDRSGQESVSVLASLLSSLIRSYERSGHPVEVWSDDRDPVYFRYHSQWKDALCLSDEAKICGRIRSLLSGVQKKEKDDRLIVLLGYESLQQVFSVAEDYPDVKNEAEIDAVGMETDIFALMMMEEEGTRTSAQIQVEIGKYNEEVNKIRKKEEETADPVKKDGDILYNAIDDLKKLFMVASSWGIHFIFCCPDQEMLDTLRVPTEYFSHQILFDMPTYSLRRFVGEQADYLNITGSIGFYQKNKKGYSFRTHLFSGIPIRGWYVDESGQVCEG